ncbi:hypothetical protein [Streptomyces sp. MMG1533]|nr:hypothetical protein [Streptomyces sp. MMG1533]
MTAPPEPEPAPPLPTEPRLHDWDDDPRTAARYDRAYWTDRDED